MLPFSGRARKCGTARGPKRIIRCLHGAELACLFSSHPHLPGHPRLASETNAREPAKKGLFLARVLIDYSGWPCLAALRFASSYGVVFFFFLFAVPCFPFPDRAILSFAASMHVKKVVVVVVQREHATGTALFSVLV